MGLAEFELQRLTFNEQKPHNDLWYVFAEEVVSSNRDRVNAQGKRKQYSAPALEKGLDILELLAGEPEGLTISQIADRLGRSVGEIFRMVVVLDQRGYIHASGGSDVYAVTLKIFEIAHKIPAIARLESAAAPELRRLSHEIGQSCHVVIYYDGRGHVVVQQDAPSERVMTVRLGAEAPLVNTCSGHVLLAFASPQQRDMMIGEISRGQRKPTKKELAKLVERIRDQRCEVMKSAQVQGVQDIGFPIFDHTGQIAASLVVPFLAYLDESHLVPFDEARRRTRKSADAISQALGFRNTDIEELAGGS